MGRAERVVFALGSFREARQPVSLAQGADAVPPPGQDLVGVSLMADVPDDPVVGRVEEIVKRHRKLDHAETAPRCPPVTETASIVSGPQLVPRPAGAVPA